MDIHFNEKGQAVAPASRHISPAAFGPLDHTEVTWLGGAGILINSRGSCLMIDPVLEGFDMPLLYEIPILPDEVGCLDALLITHIDNDHFSRPTCQDIASVCKSWHSTQYVAEQMREEGLPGQGHDIGESFEVGNFNVKLTLLITTGRTAPQSMHTATGRRRITAAIGWTHRTARSGCRVIPGLWNVSCICRSRM